MTYYKKIVGERVYLSPFEADAPEIIAKWAEWMNDKTVADYYGGYHNLVTDEAAKKRLAVLTGYRFAIVLLDGDKLIGHVSIHDVDTINRNAWMAIAIGDRACRNKGYGGETLRLVLQFAFHTLNLHNISLSVYADNKAAIACYKKVGFKEIGRWREGAFKDGRYIDKIFMDMLDNEFTL
ncbi:MAG: GNAT family N-acetyltransferase [Oscillospiraceae bacterium]|jgi:RimJ/RimL family protein N-acetyltransferase|nr:GNAT family N-acetyltransferase [Oscillospiraceae bacterium]